LANWRADDRLGRPVERGASDNVGVNSIFHENMKEPELRRIRISSSGWAHAALREAIRDAGMEPWDDLFQSLRRSCEIEWAQKFPQFAVSKWIGHSITVSGRHYASMIPDDLFAKAADLDGAEAAQKAAQSVTESTCEDLKAEIGGEGQKQDNSAVCGDLHVTAELSRTWRGGESNPHLRIANASSSH
jgi:hypothetical protein